jgi:cbb3-type cytochrome oxidase subunit 1
MDWFVKKFLQSCLVWFAVGVTVGLLMALFPMLTVYRTAHMHVLLLGFVAQIIYGVALHVVPRFFGQPLVHRELGFWQWWGAQVGLVLLIGGFVGRVRGWGLAEPLMGTGALLSAGAAYLFIFNLWRTIARAKVNILPGAGGGTGRGDTAATPLSREPRLPLMPQPD